MPGHFAALSRLFNIYLKLFCKKLETFVDNLDPCHLCLLTTAITPVLNFDIGHFVDAT